MFWLCVGGLPQQFHRDATYVRFRKALKMFCCLGTLAVDGSGKGTQDDRIVRLTTEDYFYFPIKFKL